MVHISSDTLKFFADIILVLVVLIQLFKMMRGTRGILLLNGIIILFLAYDVSLKLGLDLLSRLLNWVMLMVVVALPIIFQHELRRALENLGSKNPLVKWFVKIPVIAVESIDIVAQAAENLAKNRVGALIVFEREDSLTVIRESGSYLDAVLSTIMLEQIFYPRSPLHDGAVVIKGDRIEAAGCFLPLSSELALPQELGSRHRAGLSLSFQSQALVVIVSEETGRISLALNGRLETDFSEERLKYRLRELVRQDNSKNATNQNTSKTQTEVR